MASSPAPYDVIVVGARPAGASTALLAALRGLRVLVVDRSAYGADAVSTHALLRAGVMQLQRWGLLGDVIASGAPPVRRSTFVLGGERLDITIKPAHGVEALYAPRRTVLDPLLVDAARRAGADVRFGVTVTGLQRDRHGRITGIRAMDRRGRTADATGRFVVGADGLGSGVARWTQAAERRRTGPGGAVAFGYWPDVDVGGYEWHYCPGVAAGAIPTNDGLTCLFVSSTPDRFRREVMASRDDGGFRTLLAAAAPELATQIDGVEPSEPLRRFPGRPGHLRQAWGPGWALVGDAGYFKDPLSAHGITDALRDAELLARALAAVVVDGEPEQEALGRYEQTRDRLSLQLFDVMAAIASFDWDLDEVSRLLLQQSSAMADEVELLAALEPLATTPAVA